MKYVKRALALPFLLVALVCHCLCGQEAVDWWAKKMRQWGMR